MSKIDARQLVKRILPLKGLMHFARNVRKRKLTLLSASPQKAAAAVKRPMAAGEEISFMKRLADLLEPIRDHVTVQSSVIACPVKDGKDLGFSGGLVNSDSHTLIEAAVHFDGRLCQELTEENLHQLGQSNMPELKQPVFFGGIAINNFGHFLLQGIGRLWAYEYVRELAPTIVFFAPHAQPKYLEKRNYVYQVLEGFGIPHQKITFISEPTRLRHVIIPAQKYGYELCKKPEPLMMKFIKGFNFVNKPPAPCKSADKVYVSRSRMPHGSGKPLGEFLFEQYLTRNQYIIFHPESHTLYEQLSVYASASKIIFCDGGAIHSCILLPEIKADIAIIARRRDYRWNWGTIFKDQFDGFDKRVLWIDEVVGQYQFGRETWHAMGIVDWHKVSQVLFEHQFVEELLTGITDAEVAALVSNELPHYIQASLPDPDMINYMARLCDKYDVCVETPGIDTSQKVAEDLTVTSPL